MIKINTKELAVALIIIATCGSTIAYLFSMGAFTASKPQEIRVFIASSLVYAVQNMTQQFEKTNNCKIIINAAGSNTLYQQIISGSQCDVFMSADFKWTNQLNASKLLENNSYQNFTSNSLIAILPKDNPKNITSLMDFIKPGVKIVMPDPSIPSGSFANQTLTKIDKTWGATGSSLYLGSEWQNYSSKFSSNVVSYELQVEDVVGKVSSGLGIADAGFAFISDSTAQGSNLQYLQIPSTVNTQGIYSIAVLNETGHFDLANKFMNYWLSSDGQDLLKRFGFGT